MEVRNLLEKFRRRLSSFLTPLVLIFLALLAPFYFPGSSNFPLNLNFYSFLLFFVFIYSVICLKIYPRALLYFFVILTVFPAGKEILINKATFNLTQILAFFWAILLITQKKINIFKRQKYPQKEIYFFQLILAAIFLKFLLINGFLPEALLKWLGFCLYFLIALNEEGLEAIFNFLLFGGIFAAGLALGKYFLDGAPIISVPVLGFLLILAAIKFLESGQNKIIYGIILGLASAGLAAAAGQQGGFFSFLVIFTGLLIFLKKRLGFSGEQFLIVFFIILISALPFVKNLIFPWQNFREIFSQITRLKSYWLFYRDNLFFGSLVSSRTNTSFLELWRLTTILGLGTFLFLIRRSLKEYFAALKHPFKEQNWQIILFSLIASIFLLMRVFFKIDNLEMFWGFLLGAAYFSLKKSPWPAEKSPDLEEKIFIFLKKKMQIILPYAPEYLMIFILMILPLYFANYEINAGYNFECFLLMLVAGFSFFSFKKQPELLLYFLIILLSFPIEKYLLFKMFKFNIGQILLIFLCLIYLSPSKILNLLRKKEEPLKELLIFQIIVWIAFIIVLKHLNFYILREFLKWQGFVLLFLTGASLKQDNKLLSSLITLLLIAASLISLGAVWQYFHSPNYGNSIFLINDNKFIRSFFIFGHPNVLASFLGLILMAATGRFFLSKTAKGQIISGIILGVISAGFFSTVSRGAILSLGITTVIFLGIILRINFSYLKKALIIVLIIFTALLPFFLTGTILRRIVGINFKEIHYFANFDFQKPVPPDNPNFDIGQRVNFFEKALQAISSNPVFGSGLGNFQHAHNFFLQIWLDFGILGLIVFVLLIINYFKAARRLLNKVCPEIVLFSFSGTIFLLFRGLSDLIFIETFWGFLLGLVYGFLKD